MVLERNFDQDILQAMRSAKLDYTYCDKYKLYPSMYVCNILIITQVWDKLKLRTQMITMILHESP